ncbi:MAG: hypothetical protein KDA80_14215, partial [Planctomycetaceae bacterium]|nr:hypothetical protein [Planctomycetaceae bacterium]
GMELGLASSAAKIAQTVPELAGHPQVLIPPSLNAVGDKLLDPVLKKAVSGDQDRARADWLKVQMPRFKHADTELADLVASLVSYDRIPDEAAQSHPEWNLPDDELLLTGRTLIGAGAFTCIACHQVGDYVPRNVAIGTKGSDLKNIGKRLRPEFYYRWTRDPLRVVPGMEMPAYKKPVPHVLDEDLHKQLAVVWRAVNDESFQAPTNPTQVEQFWQVSPDGPPRIVRDVFTVDKANGNGFIARAMAIGLPNKHALLLDLDDGTLRGWTYGDFARQRTEGKSWYWELAGSPVAEGLAPHSDWQIRFADGSMDLLFMKTPSQLKLDHYETRGDSVHIDWHAEFPADQTKISQFRVTETISPIQRGSQTGWKREVRATGLPPGASLGLGHNASWEGHFDASMNVKDSATEREDSLVWWSNDEGQLSVEYLAKVPGQPTIPVPEKVVLPFEEPITTLPGYTGQRLRLPETIMPTSITWDQNGKLVFTSLKGHVYRAIDTDKDGLEDELQTIEEGLAAPFGILTDGADLLVAHKPELLRLIDGNGDGRADERHVIADGWGYTDNYHDWTTGPVRGKNGEIFLALGSDYAQQKRDRQRAQWRGKVLRLGSNEQLSPFASELRYPIGIAADGQGRLFVTDQQGVQNTFNEINLVTEGGRYGVPGLLDEDVPEKIPTTIQVPHPWTRSVNGIFFLPDSLDSPFAGHGIGCEYNGRFLVRFTTQFVDGAAQGAVYPFTRSDWESDLNTFLGPMSGAVSPTGDIYIGSIHDSGWLGGRNTGEIVRLKKTGNIPNGIREVRATHEGFAIEFVRPVNRDWATRTESYAISAYTRVWQGSYATDDSERHAPKIVDVKLAEDGTSALLTIPDRRIGFVYEFQLNGEGDSVKTLFPTFAAFTLNRIPTDLH